MESIIHGRKGILMMRLTTASSREEVISDLAKITRTTRYHPETVDFLNSLQGVSSLSGILPTIVVEIERAGSKDLSAGIHAVRGIAKELSMECNFIIILSEASAVLEFGKDSDRENFIYIDEFNKKETEQYLKLLGLKLDKLDLDYMVNNIGMNPATLRNIQEWLGRGNPLNTVTSFVANKLKEADLDLNIFPHKQILKELQLTPEGVYPGSFNNIINEGVDLSNPAAVGVAMKSSNSVAFRIELQKYVLISKRHKIALSKKTF